jgi:hypothetical protein
VNWRSFERAIKLALPLSLGRGSIMTAEGGHLRKEWNAKIEIFAAYVLLLVIYWCIDLMQ